MSATSEPPKSPQRRNSNQRERPKSAEALRLEAERHPGVAARIAAADILRDVVVHGHLLDECFAPEAVPSRLNGLDARDRSLVRSITTVALRRLGTIRFALSELLERGLPRQAGELEWTLVAAAAQILFLDVPDHAAVDLAVRIVRLNVKTAPYASLVNGVLRNLIRGRDSFLARSDPLDHDTPAWLATRWRKIYGDATARAIARANREEPTLDVTVKSDPEAWAERLDGVVLPTGSVRLRTHGAIQDLPGYDEGAWWVQDAAAALPACFLRIGPGDRVADFCAAPGGKTAQLAAAGASVTAIDRSAERLKRLSTNLSRLGLTAQIIVGDVLKLDIGPFDAVLVDAPCTATGTIRRHPDVAWTKSSSMPATLARIQSQMLDRAIKAVKPNGIVVYCTCSMEPEEGEMQIEALLRRNPDVLRSPIKAAEVGALAEAINRNGEFRALPPQLASDQPRLSGLDGFFAARLIRRG